jgi:hypothetical protein
VQGDIRPMRPRPDSRGVPSHSTSWLQEAHGMFNLTLPRLAWPTFLNIEYILLHLDKRSHMQYIHQRGFFFFLY